MFISGCIDGNRINVDLPKDKENDYKDKNGSISLGIQGICNEKHKFIDVTVGQPGSYHDSRILKESPIYPLLSELCEGKSILLEWSGVEELFRELSTTKFALNRVEPIKLTHSLPVN